MELVRDRIFSDLRGRDGVLNDMNVRYWKVKDEPRVLWKGTYDKAISYGAGEESYIYDYKFMVNPKSCLWEIQIYTTGPVRMLREMV